MDAIGVGHPSLTKVVGLSNSYGYSCKLTGAGGGGCAITLTNKNCLNKEDFENNLNNIEKLKKELK